jgi:hypothetical protein
MKTGSEAHYVSLGRRDWILVMNIQKKGDRWTPTNDADKAAVLKQLDRVLLDPRFSNSERYPSFLNFVVKSVLRGETDSIKERVLGVEIFEQSPYYDTNQNPIVRVTAAEIRKRLVRYYDDFLHQDELRILLPTGSYVPSFELPDNWAVDQNGSASTEDCAATPEAIQSADPALPLLSVDPTDTAPAQSRHFLVPAIAITVLLAILAGGFMLWRTNHRQTPINDFWNIVTKNPNPVLLCLADQSAYSTISLLDANDPYQIQTVQDRPTMIEIHDLDPVVDLALLLHDRGGAYRVQGQAQTTITDLSSGPAILVGAFDNSWTLRLTNPLRFHFANDANMTNLRIEDRQAPAGKSWGWQTDPQAHEARKSYALIARFLNPSTGQVTVVVAGLSGNATKAAGEFLVSPEALSRLDRAAPTGWRNKNIEAVLETTVINGHAGPASIDAVHSW